MVFGLRGQERLRKAKVLIVGVGGLGSIAAYYLAAAGVGKLVIVDHERVELSNLNRQILYTSSDIGKYKVYAAKERLEKLNPHVTVVAYNRRFDEELAEKLIPDIDVAIDALDNWSTRMILNKYCVKYRKPLIHAGVREAYGQLLVVLPGKGPCLQCVFPRPREEGRIPVLGPIPGVLGALEALEAIKIITGYGEPAVGRLIVFDGRSLRMEEVKVLRNPNCPVCASSVNEQPSSSSHRI